ncbi:MAG: threonylcarbamoyl-AMP synthase [Planctomycetes bacterium]|nr:threonylcarbamoyl-AMP synthase [Planctomycetota bacterium]
MAKRKIDRLKNHDHSVAAAATVFTDGGIVVIPTETVYGIGVVSGNTDALARFRQVKDRPGDKPFQFLVADMEMARRFGAVFSTHSGRLATHFWPGPMTLVLPDGTRNGTLGVRVPDSPFALQVLRELGRPIISSSANRSGQPAPLTADDADVFGDDVDLLVDGGPVSGGVPSTVVLCGSDDYEILRPGGVPEDAIENAWNE